MHHWRRKSNNLEGMNTGENTLDIMNMGEEGNTLDECNTGGNTLDIMNTGEEGNTLDGMKADQRNEIP